MKSARRPAQRPSSFAKSGGRTAFVSSPAVAAIERAKARDLMAHARERARLALDGRPFDAFAEAPFCRALSLHARGGCPLADLPARGCWDGFMALARAFSLTTGPQRRARLAGALDAAATAFEAMLDDTQLEAAGAWKQHFKDD